MENTKNFPYPLCEYCTKVKPENRTGPYANVCSTCWQCHYLNAELNGIDEEEIEEWKEIVKNF